MKRLLKKDRKKKGKKETFLQKFAHKKE